MNNIIFIDKQQQERLPQAPQTALGMPWACPAGTSNPFPLLTTPSLAFMLIHKLLGNDTPPPRTHTHHLGLLVLAWETPGDLGAESEKGGAWGGISAGI